MWQRCRLNLPVRAACHCSFLWAKGHIASAIHSEMRPVYGDKWPNEENAGWTENCLRYGGAVGRSSVACTAADFVFFASRIHKLVERRDKCLNILGGYVEQVGVLIKRLTVGSHKQHHTIAQGV